MACITPAWSSCKLGLKLLVHTASHGNIFTQNTLITFQKQANHNHLPSSQTERQRLIQTIIIFKPCMTELNNFIFPFLVVMVIQQYKYNDKQKISMVLNKLPV